MDGGSALRQALCQESLSSALSARMFYRLDLTLKVGLQTTHCYPHNTDEFVEVGLLFPYVWLDDSPKAKSRDHLYFPTICPGFKVRTRRICILGV